MSVDVSIVNPVSVDCSCLSGTAAIMVSVPSDFKLLSNLAAARFVTKKRLYTSWVNIYKLCDGSHYSIVGPFIGAPYAAMLLDTLMVWGVKKFIFVGWCGSISDGLQIGDVVVPDGSIIDEGTSCHYSSSLGSVSLASFQLTQIIKKKFKKKALFFYDGLIWTTDAVFRETREKVDYFGSKGALAVEMELSAIFTVARFHGVESSGILVVSDVLRGSKWDPGIKNKLFKKTRNLVCRLVNDLCCEII